MRVDTGGLVWRFGPAGLSGCCCAFLFSVKALRFR